MTRYLYIDAHYLHEAHAKAMSEFYGFVPPINYRDLSATLGGSHERVFYYDAVDRQRVGDESDKQRDDRIAEKDAFLAYLNALPQWHVREGFVSRGRRASRRSQKAVDVQLAVDAMEHAASRIIDGAVFVLGDLDFEPLLFSLNRLGVRTTVLYERGTATEELLEAADRRDVLDLKRMFDISMPEFQHSHPAVLLTSDCTAPDGTARRQGVWKGRSASFIQVTTHLAMIWVEPGPDKIRQPALQVNCQTDDFVKTDLAFTMTHGPIQWLS